MLGLHCAWDLLAGGLLVCRLDSVGLLVGLLALFWVLCLDCFCSDWNFRVVVMREIIVIRILLIVVLLVYDWTCLRLRLLRGVVLFGLVCCCLLP